MPPNYRFITTPPQTTVRPISTMNSNQYTTTRINENNLNETKLVNMKLNDSNLSPLVPLDKKSQSFFQNESFADDLKKNIDQKREELFRV